MRSLSGRNQQSIFNFDWIAGSRWINCNPLLKKYQKLPRTLDPRILLITATNFFSVFNGSAVDEDVITLTATYDVDDTAQTVTVSNAEGIIGSLVRGIKTTVWVTRSAKMIAVALVCEEVVACDMYIETGEYPLFYQLPELDINLL